jgi:Chaperone of endosialidase
MMIHSLLTVLNPLTLRQTLYRNRTCNCVLTLLALTGWGAMPEAQAECREGCTLTNTFLGEDALAITTGSANTAVGSQAMSGSERGDSNTAVGAGAAQYLTGQRNIAVGNGTLYLSSGGENSALGYGALARNRGGGNTAVGEQALLFNFSGHRNTAVGQWALRGKESGSYNIALGYQAGSALKSGDNNIAIGNIGLETESNTIRLGTSGSHQSTYVAGISGVTVAGGIGVVVDTNGQLGTMTSSARYKEKIEPMGEASDKLLSLQPVKFRYKKNLDPKSIPQFGLVAEDVAKVDPDLVARDASGTPYSVRYEAVNAMLLNEFLKEHRKVEAQGAEIAELKSTVAELKTALEEQAGMIREVGAQTPLAERSTILVSNEQER